MNRRGFLALTAFTPLAHLLPAYGRPCRTAQQARELQSDLVICGAGVGGVACALAAARNGLKVILTEEYDWIGGQLTAQAVPPDEHPWIEDTGSTKTYRTFRTKVRDYYRRNYPLTEAAAKDAKLNPGKGSVSKLCHEPRVALAVLLELLAPHLSSGRVKLLQPFRAVRAETDGDTVTAVGGVFKNGKALTLTAPYFVDATELGDLLPLAKIEHVTGAESGTDTREPHAPDRARPDNHQAFTVCFALDHDPDGDHTIEKPGAYKEWRDYVPKLDPAWPGNLLSWEMSDPVTLKPRAVGFDPTGPVPKGLNLWTYRRILARDNGAEGSGVRDVCLVNWPQNDYWLGNLYDNGKDAAAHLA
ncbi:MAG: FAD-dependent oxidoreductase, partial [Gemmataceae bacterium]|nr:FAD-dependent oxidoreductase [Gemmataceae bacterium]